jgi:putative ABC transport system permease protein
MRLATLFRLLRHVSVQEHRSRPTRTLLVVISLAFGVAMTVAMRLATDAAVSGLRDDLGRIAGKAALQVTFGTGEARLPESVVDMIRAEPLVAAAAAVLRGSLSFADETRETIEIFGVDLLQKDLRTIHDVEVVDRNLDELPVATNPRAIFLSEVIAAERQLRVGDVVALSGPKGTSDYSVQGILRTRGFGRVYGGRTGVMYLPSAQLAFTDLSDPLESTVHQVDVALVSGTSVEEAKSALRRILPPELSIEEPIQRGVELARSVDGLRATLLGVSSLALLAALFIVYSANVAMIASRTPTFATLRSLGVGPRPLRALVLLEAFSLGVIGGAVGVPLGFVFANVALGDVAAGMELNYALRVAPSALVSGLRPILLGYVLLGGAASLAAAFLPSRRIALRYDDTGDRSTRIADEQGSEARTGLVVAGLVIVALGVAALIGGVAVRVPWACALGGTVTIVGIVLALLRVVDLVWQRVARGAIWRYRSTSWLALENLVRDTERSLVAVAAIALCGAVAIAAATLPGSFRASATEWYGFRGDVTLASRTPGKGWIPAAMMPAQGARIAELPAIARMETLRVLHGQPFRDARIALVALSSGYLGEVARKASGACSARGDELADGRAVIASENFAERFGARAGDTLVVESPSGPISLSLCGLIPDFASDQGSIVLSAGLLKTRWRDDLVNYVSVDLRPAADVAALRRQLIEHVGADHGLIVFETGELRASIEKILADAFRDVDGIQLLVFFITFAGIVDLVASAVVDRRREFTLLRAIGARDRAIVRSVAVEAGILGLTAGGMAVAVGALFSHLWLRYIYPILVGYVLNPDFAWQAAAVVLLLACATAVIGGYVAVRIALRSLSPEVARVH